EFIIPMLVFLMLFSYEKDVVLDVELTEIIEAQIVPFSDDVTPPGIRALKRIRDKTISIVFVGIRGDHKQKFKDEQDMNFDLPMESDMDDMIRELDRHSTSSLSFMPLSHDQFLNSEIKISYSSGTTITVQIGKQFDAIITYSDISTLTSMDTYDWN
ncbi:MAG: hypothetical protein OEQ53_08750, partial [Saprospiraceae bacterium]|nr:hypothetical protein [Saprospiraceae bacterium]